MKKLMLVLIVTSCAILGASAQAKKDRPKLTEEQKEMLIMMKVGGFIYQPIPTKVVRVYNDQKVVPAEIIEEMAVCMRKGPHFPVEVVNGPWRGEPQKEDGVGFALVVSKDESLKTKILCAPDDGWAKVNVAALMTDKPDVEKLNLRVRREMWRALGYSLGVGNTQMPLCVMKPVASLGDLDKLGGYTSEPNTLVPMAESGKKWGINVTRKVTYKKACKEGWAPAPTNEFQKAIWDEVHELPTKPIGLKVQK